LLHSNHFFKNAGGWWCYPTPSEGWGREGQSGYAPRSGPEVKNGNRAKDGATERLRCGTIQEENQVLQRVSTGAA